MAAPARRREIQPASGGGCGVGCGITLAVIAGLVAIGTWSDGLVVPGILFSLIAGAGAFYAHGLAKHDKELRRVRAIQSTEIARYHAMNPREFEIAIAYLCERDGCHGARVVGGAGDLGADVIATAPDGRRIVIQCKRYGPTTKVGSPDLQRFGGTCYSVHNAQIAVVVTTSVFTKPAAQYAANHGIRLFDETVLAAWVTRTGPAPWML